MLFDLRADPGETTNIAHERRGLASAMSDAYDTWFGEVTRSTNAKVQRFPITLTEGTGLLIPSATLSGGVISVSIGGRGIQATMTEVYDPPVIPRRDLIPRWEVPDKVLRPLKIGPLSIPAGQHELQVTGAPGIEVQAVRLATRN